MNTSDYGLILWLLVLATFFLAAVCIRANPTTPQGSFDTWEMRWSTVLVGATMVAVLGGGALAVVVFAIERPTIPLATLIPVGVGLVVLLLVIDAILCRIGNWRYEPFVIKIPRWLVRTVFPSGSVSDRLIQLLAVVFVVAFYWASFGGGMDWYQGR